MSAMWAGASLRVGVDLGGTGSRVVALSESGDIAASLVVDTRSFGSGAAAVGELAEHVRQLCSGTPLRGVGVGASGPLDREGVIRNPDTLPEFDGVPIARMLSTELAVPCVAESDAAVFALGEFHHGAGRQVHSLVGVTLGTGVGVGVVVDGRLHRGADGLHPEGGHLPTPGPPAPCYCGLETCWEQRASRTALERLLAQRQGSPSVEQAAAAAAAGDPDARALFTRFGSDVGVGLAAFATLFRPELIVVGGGVSPYLDLMRDGLREALARNGEFEITARVVPGELGAFAGAVGAATLV